MEDLDTEDFFDESLKRVKNGIEEFKRELVNGKTFFPEINYTILYLAMGQRSYTKNRKYPP